MAVLPIYIASLAHLASCLQSDLQLVGCYLYFSTSSEIDEGKYIRSNLSQVTCFQECQKMLNWTSSLALAKQTLCLCDSDLEDLEKTEKVGDERCRFECRASLLDTEYCGHHDTMAVYAVSSPSNCATLLQIDNGAITFDTSKVRFHCNEGYVISGNDHLICQRANGSWQWSGPVPYCINAMQTEKAALPVVLGILFATLIVILALGSIVFGYLYKKRNSLSLNLRPTIEQIYGEHVVNEELSDNHTPAKPPSCLDPAQESTGNMKYENICNPSDCSTLPPVPSRHYWCDVSDTTNSENNGRDEAHSFTDVQVKKHSTHALQVYGHDGNIIKYTTVQASNQSVKNTCKNGAKSVTLPSTSSSRAFLGERSKSTVDRLSFIKFGKRNVLRSTYEGVLKGKNGNEGRSASVILEVKSPLEDYEKVSIPEA